MEARGVTAPEGYLEMRRRKTYIVFAVVYGYFLINIASKYKVIDLTFISIPGLDLMLPLHNYLLAAASTIPFLQYLFGTRVYKQMTMYNYDQLQAFSKMTKVKLIIPVILLATLAIKEAAILSIVFITVYIWFLRAYRPMRVDYDFLDRYEVERRDGSRFR